MAVAAMQTVVQKITLGQVIAREAAAAIGTLSIDTAKAAQVAGDMPGRLVPDFKRTATLVEKTSPANGA